MKLIERYKDWLLDRYHSIKTVAGVRIPSRYAPTIGVIVVFVLTAMFVISLAAFWIAMLNGALACSQ